VLHKTKYGDHGLIVKIYTEKCGTQSFIVKNAFSKKAKINQSLFGLMSMLEINFDGHRLAQLRFLKDANCAYHYQNVPFDASRSAILFFYNELIYKLLYNAPEDAQLFRFLEEHLLELDNPDCRLADVHIRFMVSLSKVLGLLPENNYSERHPFFSMEEACFTDFFVDNLSLGQAESEYLSKLLYAQEHGETLSVPNKMVRINLLRGLVSYFELHHESVSNMQSMNVLCDVLN